MDFFQHLHDRFIRNSVTCIVWDFDGTLYTSSALADALYAAYERVYAKYAKRGVVTLDAASQRAGSWSRAIADVSGRDEYQVLADIDRRVDYSKFVRPDPAIPDLIRRLSGYRHFIMSNASLDQITGSLPKIGLSSRMFECIADRNMLKYLKPDKRAFDCMLRITGEEKKKHLMIGDSEIHDIIPARQFGFYAVHRDRLPVFFR